MYKENMCRICLVEEEGSERFERLFNEDSEKLTELGELFEYVLQLEILGDSSEPKCICSYCQSQLTVYHKFKNKALESYKKFSAHKIKNEFSSKDDEAEENVKVEDAKENVKAEFGSDVESSENLVTEEFEEVQYLEDENFLEVYEAFDENDCMVSQRDSNSDGDDGDKEEDMISNQDMQLEELGLKSFIERETLFCKDCNECFTKKSQLSSHRKTVHPPRTKFKCTLCPKVFLSKEALDAHVKVHNGLPAYECEECFKTFKQKGRYVYHMMGHKNERNVQCHLCGKGFINNCDLKIHLRVHNDERRYECDVCGRMFRAHTHMTNHRYSHFEKQFECSLCPHKYSSPNNLRRHIRSVHIGECPYTCEICNKKFKRKHHLKAHGRTHTRSFLKIKVDKDD